jgi:hypothetical protein
MGVCILSMTYLNCVNLVVGIFKYLFMDVVFLNKCL